MKNTNVLFTNNHKLKEIYHMWTTNRNESMNKSITKMARKDTYLCFEGTYPQNWNAGVEDFYWEEFTLKKH